MLYWLGLNLWFFLFNDFKLVSEVSISDCEVVLLADYYDLKLDRCFQTRFLKLGFQMWEVVLFANYYDLKLDLSK